MEREEAIEILTDMKRIRSNKIAEACDMAISALKGGDAEMNETKSPFMQETPSEDGSDLISRAELTKHFKTFDEKYLTLDTICDAVQSAPSVSVPQGDLISRAEAVFMIGICSRVGDLAEKEKWEQCMEYVNKLPSVSAERVGVWEHNEMFKKEVIFCSECGLPFRLWDKNDIWHYCPNCGTRMENTK